MKITEIPKVTPFGGGIGALSRGSQIADEDVESAVKIASALAHPLRIQILQQLAKQDGSASSIAKKIRDVSLQDVSYHLNERLHHKLELIEVAEGQDPAQGASKIVYKRLDAASLVGAIARVFV